MLKPYYLNNECLVYDHFKCNTQLNLDFHNHDTFEIYFFISGSVNYIIEKKVHSLNYGDLLIINSNEVHKPTFVSNKAYERITIHFDPAIPRLFNFDSYNLLSCFINRSKGEKNKISLNKQQLDIITGIFDKIEKLEKISKPWSSLLKLTSFIEMLVYIDSIYYESNIIAQIKPEYVPEKLAQVLDYINLNISKDLSLKTLEQKLYINRYHLCKMFKKLTGSTLHDYIINERISRAKLLLARGSSVTEACMESGFNDYSNFIHKFKKIVGITPDSFRKSMLGRSAFPEFFTLPYLSNTPK